MANIVDTKAGEFTLVDGLIVGASKVGSEELLARVPFVGNGTFRSGIIKTVTAVIATAVLKQKLAKLAATGVLVDGMEDIVISIKRQLTNGNSSGTSTGRTL